MFLCWYLACTRVLGPNQSIGSRPNTTLLPITSNAPCREHEIKIVIPCIGDKLVVCNSIKEQMSS